LPRFLLPVLVAIAPAAAPAPAAPFALLAMLAARRLVLGRTGPAAFRLGVSSVVLLLMLVLLLVLVPMAALAMLLAPPLVPLLVALLVGPWAAPVALLLLGGTGALTLAPLVALTATVATPTFALLARRPAAPRTLVLRGRGRGCNRRRGRLAPEEAEYLADDGGLLGRRGSGGARLFRPGRPGDRDRRRLLRRNTLYRRFLARGGCFGGFAGVRLLLLLRQRDQVVAGR
jgi:hypothetical protein